MWPICGRRWRCSKPAARCTLVNWNWSKATPVESHGHGAGEVIAAAERFGKTRRLATLRQRLEVAERALAAGRPSITVGGKRLWRNRNHLEAAEMSEQRWRDRWDASRLFLTADGESGKVGGNETIRVDTDGRLCIKTPTALVAQLGPHVVIDAPICFAHRGDEWAERVAARRAGRHHNCYEPPRGRGYL
jgi:hypothetical protein